MTGVRVGAVYRPQFAPERLADTARAADAAGLEELWLWEDCFLTGGISTAAIALSATSRITVGLGVLPVPMRNVAAAAMEIATLHRAFPGRVRVGVGHGVASWMAQIGAAAPSPMTLLREYLTALRALLDGQQVTVEGSYVRLDHVQLEWPPQRGVELLCGATGPKTLALSGELASGTVITGGTTAQELREAVGHIRNGQLRRADPAPHAVVVYVECVAGQSGSQIAAAAGPWVDAGADTIVFQCGPDTDIAEFVAMIGSEVQPLMHRAHP